MIFYTKNEDSDDSDAVGWRVACDPGFLRPGWRFSIQKDESWHGTGGLSQRVISLSHNAFLGLSGFEAELSNGPLAVSFCWLFTSDDRSLVELLGCSPTHFRLVGCGPQPNGTVDESRFPQPNRGHFCGERLEGSVDGHGSGSSQQVAVYNLACLYLTKERLVWVYRGYNLIR